jgi:hypothetical protein
VDTITGPAYPMTRDDLPAAYRAASDSSKRGKNRSVRLSAIQLVLLVGGSLLGGVQTVVGGWLNIGALAAAVALTLSLVPAVGLATFNPQKSWYRGRAGAESIKTLAWKYAVRASPYAGDEEAALVHLAEDVRAIRDDLPEIPWPAGGSDPTAAMRALRAAPLPARRGVYLTVRLDGQLEWYRATAKGFVRSSRWWLAVALVSTGLGLGLGFLRAFNVISYDGLGAACAIAAAATAWLQLKQYRPLLAAYTLTADELASSRADLVDVEDEKEWAQKAHDAEEAISREHTMWQARREAA